MGLRFSLKEQDTTGAGAVHAAFSTVAGALSMGPGPNALGQVWAFVNVNRAWLHGKTIKWSWAASLGFEGGIGGIGTLQYAFIWDGSYDRTDDDDFPAPSLFWNPLIKGEGVLQTLASIGAQFGALNWVDEEVVADTSAGTEEFCCIMFRCQDGLGENSYSLSIDDFQILDEGEIVVDEPFTAEVVMEVTGTDADYGYISTGDPPEPPVPLAGDGYFAKGGKDMFINKGIVIPRFTVSDLPGITFGGFIVDKYICSQPKAAPSNGAPTIAHGGSPAGTAARSTPGAPVWDYVMLSHAMVACCNRGKGWHLLTPFEWAALAWMSKKMGSQPHGGNANLNPPSDIDFPYEEAALDRDLNAVHPTWFRALPGTGPASWAHTGKSLGGVYDLQGLVWQWLMGFMTTDGFLRYPANFELSYLKSPYGRGTISDSGDSSPTLTCDGVGGNWLKAWTADEFNGADYSIFIAEAGVLYEVPQDTTPTTLVLPSGADPDNGVATFVILKTGDVDITQDGDLNSGDLITSLITDITDDLSRLAIPLSSDEYGAEEFGYDIFGFSVSSERGMVRGGCFSDGNDAGIFALCFENDPVANLASIGFRAAKAF
jgi:hypothetical protein